MTRRNNFSLNAKSYMDGRVDLATKLQTCVMGKIVEPTRAVTHAFGESLTSGARSLQAAGSFAVQKGVYAAKRAYAYANIAEKVASGPSPNPA